MVENIKQTAYKFVFDIAYCIANYEEDVYENVITSFIEDSHAEFYELLEKGYSLKQPHHLKRAYHSIKITPRYLSETVFQQECQTMENLSKQVEDLEKSKSDLTKSSSEIEEIEKNIRECWELLTDKRYTFLRQFNALYVELLKYYVEIKIKYGEDVKEEYLKRIKLPQLVLLDEWEATHPNEQDTGTEPKPEPPQSEVTPTIEIIQQPESFRDNSYKIAEMNKSDSSIKIEKAISSHSDSEKDSEEEKDEATNEIGASMNKRLTFAKRNSILYTIKSQPIEEEDEREKIMSSNTSLQGITFSNNLYNINKDGIEYDAEEKKQSEQQEQLKNILKIDRSKFKLISKWNNLKDVSFELEYKNFSNKNSTSYKDQIKSIFRERDITKLIEVLQRINEEVFRLNFMLLHEPLKSIISKLQELKTFPSLVDESDFLQLVENLEAECDFFLKGIKQHENRTQIRSDVKKTTTFCGPAGNSPVSQKKKIDDYFNSFNGVKLNDLYLRKDLQNVDISKEIQNLKAKYAPEPQSTEFSKRRKSVMPGSGAFHHENSISDAYPFKQEKFECLIF